MYTLENFLANKLPSTWEEVHDPLFKKGDVVSPILNNKLSAVIVSTQGTILINKKRYWLYAMVDKKHYKEIKKRERNAKTLLDQWMIYSAIPLYYESEHLLKFHTKAKNL
jgi:hypothetical protein